MKEADGGSTVGAGITVVDEVVPLPEPAGAVEPGPLELVPSGELPEDESPPPQATKIKIKEIRAPKNICDFIEFPFSLIDLCDQVIRGIGGLIADRVHV